MSQTHEPAPCQTSSSVLKQRLIEQSASALRSGALQPIETGEHRMCSGGVNFQVRIARNLRLKARDHTIRRQIEGPDYDPFLPPETELHLARLTPTHSAILNKFNVLKHHILIITDAFVEQEQLLDQADFEALRCCMNVGPGLGFYNGGKIAGASQRHKHLQWAPLPSELQETGWPIEALFIGLPSGASIQQIPGLQWPHAFTWLDHPADAWWTQYRGMAEMLGIARVEDSATSRQLRPYNLIMTKLWMLVVPRSCEHWESVSMNALGFAGSLFVRDEQQLALVEDAGPMECLKAVAGF